MSRNPEKHCFREGKAPAEPLVLSAKTARREPRPPVLRKITSLSRHGRPTESVLPRYRTPKFPVPARATIAHQKARLRARLESARQHSCGSSSVGATVRFVAKPQGTVNSNGQQCSAAAASQRDEAGAKPRHSAVTRPRPLRKHKQWLLTPQPSQRFPTTTETDSVPIDRNRIKEGDQPRKQSEPEKSLSRQEVQSPIERNANEHRVEITLVIRTDQHGSFRRHTCSMQASKPKKEEHEHTADETNHVITDSFFQGSGHSQSHHTNAIPRHVTGILGRCIAESIARHDRQLAEDRAHRFQ